MRNWPHQTRSAEATWAALDRGVTRLAVASPTGSGKTKMMEDVILAARERDWSVALYTHRKLLFEQVSAFLSAIGIEHGFRASGYEPRFELPVQLAMLQTEHSRAHKGDKWFPNRSTLAIFDEIHAITGQQTADIMESHEKCIGYTATPLDISELWDELYVAATNSECRECGAIVPAYTYAPSEPDMKVLKQAKVGDDFSAPSLNKAFCTQPIFASVREHYLSLNPDMRPTMLFGPDVRGSLWFAEMFTANGIRAAHIDGEDVWLDGESYASNKETREWVIQKFRDGEIKVLCNRFVLREGINIPEVYHGILATAFGSLASYVQSCGRILRAHPSMDHVIIQDHGGNWWRHGSINCDRHWELGDTNSRLCGMSAERMRERNENPSKHVGEDGEPVLCHKCYRPRRVIIGEDWKTCTHCGYRCASKSRYVIQVNGKLKEMDGDIYKPRRRKEIHNDERDWTRMYYRARNSKNGMTFLQAEALWAMEHKWVWPRRDMRLMPLNEADWFRTVSSVDPKGLRDGHTVHADQKPRRQPPPDPQGTFV